MMAKKFTILFSFIFILTSCGQTDEQKVKNAIETANHYLSARKCSEAIRELESVGRQVNNTRWLITYASANACNGGFDEPTFFSSDLTKLAAGSTAMLGSLTLFGTSSTYDPFSTTYASLKTALDTLLYPADLTSSSHANRLTKFTSSEVNNMDAFAIYILLTQLGRYLYHYGNPNATGVKGGGAGTNTCLVTYTDATALAATNLGATGSCTNAANTGHPDIETGVPATRHARMCNGLVLFNNFIDLISNLSFTGANTGTLSGLGTTFGTICTTAFGAGAAVCTTKDQAACETNITTPQIEQFFASIFETLFI